MQTTAVMPMVTAQPAGWSQSGLVSATVAGRWAEKTPPGAQRSLAECVEAMNIVPSICVAFRDRQSLLREHKGELAAGRLVLRRGPCLDIGTVVCIDIGIADESLWVQGLAVVRPTRRDSKEGCSTTLDFLEGSRSLPTALAQEDDTASALFVCRRARRFYAFFDARCAIDDQHFVGRVRDISRTGLFLLTQAVVPVGKRVTMRLVPECRDTMLVTATVARQSCNGVGLRFVSCPQEQASSLRELYRRIQDRATRLGGEGAPGR